MFGSTRPRRIRYALMGLGHIAQHSLMPAFANARDNSELAALLSDDAKKLRVLGKKYGVRRCFTYDEFDDALEGVDALFIALPNHLHREYAVRAMDRGVHVLCEKPMALTVADCSEMIQAAARSRVRLMIAYRLHFEKGNLEALRIARSGKLGTLRYFGSSFSMQVRSGNIRLRSETGGGTLFDIGIYCINAARHLFDSEPVEVYARSTKSPDPRFREVDEMTSAVLHFPGARLASFTCSFGATGIDRLQLVGTRGDLELEPAYTHREAIRMRLTVGDRARERKFRARDQFGPEIAFFSNCIFEGRNPEPDGWEGLADVRVIEALLKSARLRAPVKLAPMRQTSKPSPAQEIHMPKVKPKAMVNAESPRRKSA